jgi:hypothetical protein
MEGVAWSVQRIPTTVFSFFYTGAATVSSKQLLSCTLETEWAPFHTHYFSENLVAPGIEPGTYESVARNSDHKTTEAHAEVRVAIAYLRTPRVIRCVYLNILFQIAEPYIETKLRCLSPRANLWVYHKYAGGGAVLYFTNLPPARQYGRTTNELWSIGQETVTFRWSYCPEICP